MKIVKISFLMALLSSSYAAQAGVFVQSDDVSSKGGKVWLKCESLEDLESFEERKSALLKENFKENKCITPLEEFTNVDEKFKLLKRNFPSDLDLKLSHARLLVKFEKIEGVIEFSHYILSKPNFTEEHAIEFMNILGSLPPLRNHMENIRVACMEPKLFPIKNNLFAGIKDPNSLAGQSMLKRRIDNRLFEELCELFQKVKADKSIYDATFNIIISYINSSNYYKQAITKIVNYLYTNDKQEASPPLKEWYSIHYLMQEKKFGEVIKLYEPILETDFTVPEPYRTPALYDLLAGCYVGVFAAQKDSSSFSPLNLAPENEEKLKKAQGLLQMMLKFDDIPISKEIATLQKLGSIQFCLKHYDLALDNYRKVMNASEEILDKAHLNIKNLNKDYKTILQAAGKTKEVEKILCDEQKKILEKNERIATLIKLAQDQHQKEKKEAKRVAQEHQQLQAELLEQKKQTAAQQTSIEENVFPLTVDVKKEVQVPKKEKIKTRKATNQKPIKVVDKPQPKKSLIHIEALTENKKARITFEKLFYKYRNDIKSDSNVQISLNKIEKLFEALNQDYDASKGHGSHKKGTLNVQELGSEMHDQMVIFTNKTYLKPEQIKALREAFVNARIVPNDPQIINKLKQDGKL